MLLFFNIGIPEILVIGVVILIFFGSKGTPGILRSMGRGIRQVRAASDELQREFKSGINDIRNDVEKKAKEEPAPGPMDQAHDVPNEEKTD